MAERRAPVTAPELLLKIVLTGTQTHYESRGLVDEKRLERLLHAGKQILYKSHQESDVRANLGFSPQVWEGLTAVLHRAIPVLEQQSFAWKSSKGNDYDGSSSDLIAANYLPLVKDIERLNDLCTIARNLLATTRKAQNLAAEKTFDQQILKLIDVCVRVTARGFDGETNARNQDRWQKVVNLYKRLLITCLQFLHNFIMHNEHRKLVLWLDLFGNTSAAAQQAQQTEIQAVQDQINFEGRLSVQAEVESVGGSGREPQVEHAEHRQRSDLETPRDLQEDIAADLGYSIDDVHALFELMSAEKVLDPASQEKKKVLMEKIRTDLEHMSGLTATQLDDNPDILLRAGAALREHLALRELSAKTAARPPPIPRRAPSLLNTRGAQWSNLPDLTSYANLATVEQEITEDDLVMPRTSDSAAETLQEAKDELMARLQDTQQMIDESGEQVYEASPDGEGVLENDVIDSAEESIEEDEEDEEEEGEDEEDEEEEEDYRRLGDQERGLLTDVPLVLGPTEIEALPMIIQAGIVDNFGMKNNTVEKQGARNMQAVRCHILLAQEAGRNVLRELLIFIAAWDLPDDEFYFKMMVQIMEAILKNGLMSHAYSDFGQAKDIISPAQAVVIKILTHIFRTKYSPSSNQQNSDERLPIKARNPASLSRVDVLTVRYIFTVFRGNIIPETCALIYLQGQIRDNLAIAEDFPLNLWDMERVYEGVYQFLEFFAVLTENNDWKRLLIEWEIVYDLVTLIKELDASIPKASLASSLPSHGKAPPRDRAGFRNIHAYTTQSTPISVERPYDRSQSGASITKPLTQATQSPDQDPSTFEWRNLKKLIVLVLSSLVWKSPVVQTQIRLHGGVPTILSCTQYDGHNPYIKEHAVMCLKFLLEGNRENQAIIRDLEARGVANVADLEKEFGVRAEVRDGRVRIEQQAPRQAPRTYHQDLNSFPEPAPQNGASMADRFNTIDMAQFSSRLPIRSAPPHHQSQQENRRVDLPQSQSIRDAHEPNNNPQQPDPPTTNANTAHPDTHKDIDTDHSGQTKRVLDVGDML